jgi:hypothetical protein
MSCPFLDGFATDQEYGPCTRGTRSCPRGSMKGRFGVPVIKIVSGAEIEPVSGYERDDSRTDQAVHN